MNIVERARRDCQITVKAYHNLHAAHRSMERLIQLAESDDALLLSSIFLSAVIRYGRPFSQTSTKDGNVTFPTKPLKNTPGFDTAMHEHLLLLRNLLMAHDDLEEIPPPILTNCLQMHGSKISVPMVIHISNKALGYPSDLGGAEKIKNHIAAALKGAAKRMDDVLVELRTKTIGHPELAEEGVQLNEHQGTQTVPETGMRVVPPDLSNHPYLSVKEPGFSNIHNGYHYEPFAMKREFFGPEEILLENGEKIVISPPRGG